MGAQALESAETILGNKSFLSVAREIMKNGMGVAAPMGL
ncbi:MAG: hypothetical protein ACI8VW_001221 [bacterium]